VQLVLSRTHAFSKDSRIRRFDPRRLPAIIMIIVQSTGSLTREGDSPRRIPAFLRVRRKLGYKKHSLVHITVCERTAAAVISKTTSVDVCQSSVKRYNPTTWLRANCTMLTAQNTCFPASLTREEGDKSFNKFSFNSSMKSLIIWNLLLLICSSRFFPRYFLPLSIVWAA
jgi:hypothetical protein